MTKENKDKELEKNQVESTEGKVEKEKKTPAKPGRKKAPTKKKSQLLTADKLREIDEKNSKKLSVTVKLFGEDFDLEVDAYFRPTKQQRVLDRTMEFYDLMEDDTIGADVFSLAPYYTAMMILKEFTSLEVPDPIKDQIAFLYVLIDNEAINPILEVLPMDQLERVQQFVAKVFDTIDEEMKRQSTEVNELIESGAVMNKEVIDLYNSQKEKVANEKVEDEDKPLN